MWRCGCRLRLSSQLRCSQAGAGVHHREEGTQSVCPPADMSMWVGPVVWSLLVLLLVCGRGGECVLVGPPSAPHASNNHPLPAGAFPPPQDSLLSLGTVTRCCCRMLLLLLLLSSLLFHDDVVVVVVVSCCWCCFMMLLLLLLFHVVVFVSCCCCLFVSPAVPCCCLLSHGVAVCFSCHSLSHAVPV